MIPESSDAKTIISWVKSHDGVVIRGFRSKSELRDSLQRAVDEGRPCVFWPSRSALRRFFNTQGFILAVKEVETELRDFVVQIGPRAYGVEHLYVISPRPLTWTE